MIHYLIESGIISSMKTHNAFPRVKEIDTVIQQEHHNLLKSVALTASNKSMVFLTHQTRKNKQMK